MPRRVKGPSGVVQTFPDDATDEEIAAALSEEPRVERTPDEDVARLFGREVSRPEPPRPSLSDQMRDRPLMERLTQPIPERLTDPETGKDIPVLGSPGVLAFASTSGFSLPGAVKSVPGVIAKGLGISKARAAANIGEAVTAAKDVPLNVAQSIQKPLAEIMQYKRIETIPMSVRTLATRLESGAPFTVEEARKFYPAISRMSAADFAKLTPNMQRLVGGLRAAMNEGITAAADTVGKGAQYASGMKEYARAGKAAKLGKQAATVSGLTGAGYAAAGWLKKLLGDAVGGR